MLEAIVSGLAALATPQAVAFMLIGVIYGLIIGILPGLGGIVAMALLLPFTYGFEVAATLALLLGAHIATVWGDSVTSILFNVPGAAKALPLCFDGYPMTQQGQATRALGASATAALLGGVVGAVFLALCIPLVRPLMLALGPSEYLMMALWGLTIIATFSEGSLLKGLIAAAFGVLVAFVGMDVVTATPRFTFGIPFLMDGISFPVAMIGMFAVAEMMKLYVKGSSIVDRDLVHERSTVLDGVKDAFRHRWLVVRSSLLGLWIGVLPGVGATVGGLAAYAQAVQTSKTPERFGKGAV
jgi:putative tricarboxylic transport membrane protein